MMAALRGLRDVAHCNTALRGAVRSSYGALNWLRGRKQYYLRAAPYLADMEFDEVRFSNRGNEPEAHLRRTRRLGGVRGRDLLVLGAGDGSELELWRRQRPRSLAACDVFAHETWGAADAIDYARMDVRALAYADASFDVVASTALLEHVPQMEALCDEMARVLRPGALAFANFGPLYYTYGGAHFRGAYEHLQMSAPAFTAWLEARDDPYERQEALHWLRHGMFSRLTYDEYLRIFRERFDIEHLVLAVSPQALAYRRREPRAWARLGERYDERDLLTFAMTVWMRPRGTSASRRQRPERVAVESCDAAAAATAEAA